MNEYEKQAQSFLERTISTLEARFVACKAGHFSPEDAMRDIWEIRLNRHGREYIFKFGNSVMETEARLKTFATDQYHNPYNYMVHGTELGSMVKLRITKWEKTAKEWATDHKHAPTAYSVLAAIGSEPPSNVDDFAEEFGYTKPSDAIRVFAALTREYAALQSLYNEKEMGELQEIS